MTSSRPPSYHSRIGFSTIPDNDELFEAEETPRQSLLGTQNRSRILQKSSKLIHRHRKALRAAPAAIASTLWLTMMVYFFVYYTTVLDKVNSSFPRIGPAYSVWPYISCVGAVQLKVFQGFAIVVATLVITAFSLDFWLARHIEAGRWFRVAKLSLAVISDSFLVALSYESVNTAEHLHLIFTSIQIWCMGSAKLVDDALNHCMRRYDPKNHHLNVAKRWKRIAGLIALLTGPVAIVGIYGCNMPVGHLSDTAQCWKLVAWSAPCEWILSLCWSAYLYMVAYDLYHAEEVRESVMAKSAKGFRLLHMDAARVVGNIDDTVPLTSLQSISRPSPGYFGKLTSYTAVKEQAMSDEEEQLC